jgi:hypothetical protein
LRVHHACSQGKLSRQLSLSAVKGKSSYRHERNIL